MLSFVYSMYSTLAFNLTNDSGTITFRVLRGVFSCTIDMCLCIIILTTGCSGAVTFGRHAFTHAALQRGVKTARVWRRRRKRKRWQGCGMRPAGVSEGKHAGGVIPPLWRTRRRTDIGRRGDNSTCADRRQKPLKRRGTAVWYGNMREQGKSARKALGRGAAARLRISLW
jgi:hypothetical protein